jgi:predicted metal-dependent hydrolase
MREFVFGTFVYEYELIRQERKTLSLTVRPDLRIVLKCPEGVDAERIESFLQKKWFWLEKQLSFFKKYRRKFYEKEYISGEGYLYLGRQYKLVVKRGEVNSVVLTRGQLIVFTTKSVSDGRHNKKLIDSWFGDKTIDIFQARFDEMLKRFDYKNAPKLSLRVMKRRWGSYLKQDKIFLNPKLIHMSRECIDYVIVHELCHMRYKNHDKRFYTFLDKQFPKWEKVKEKLETVGSTIC